MASKSDCKEEFLNYMHYQIGRADESVRPFLNKALDEVVNMEKQFENEEKYIEAIAFFFGYMARYKKYKDSIGGR
jgi:hemerythrin